MIECGGVWLPDGETHLTQWMRAKNQVVDGKLTYQFSKQRAALSYCARRRNAVDVGAHCGLWSMHLAHAFQMLYAFEPVAAHRECFALNVPYGNVVLHDCALGEREGLVSIRTEESSSGDSWVDGAGNIPMHRLDDFDLQEVDFIKLDCEGYELFALRGGEETIKRCRPTICVEQKPGKAQKFGLGETDAVAYLEGLGAQLRQVISGDYILSFQT